MGEGGGGYAHNGLWRIWLLCLTDAFKNYDVLTFGWCFGLINLSTALVNPGAESDSKKFVIKQSGLLV